jgi:hypothetical protein
MSPARSDYPNEAKLIVVVRWDVPGQSRDGKMAGAANSEIDKSVKEEDKRRLAVLRCTMAR